jgi:hypothetical protein
MGRRPVVQEASAVSDTGTRRVEGTIRDASSELNWVPVNATHNTDVGQCLGSFHLQSPVLRSVFWKDYRLKGD